MRLEQHPPPTRREAWMRMGKLCSAAALWSSDLPGVPVLPRRHPGKTIASAAVPLVPSSSDEFVLVTQLGKSRIGAIPDASLLRQQPLSLSTSKDGGMFRPQQPVYFPQFLFGAWNVTATLRQQFPIPPCEDFGADTNDSVAVHARPDDASPPQLQFFATLANTWKNQWAVNLGTGVPATKVIANRAYNLATELSWIGWKSDKSFSDLNWDYRSTATPSRVTWKDADDQLYERDVLQCRFETCTEDERVFAVTERHRIQGWASNAASPEGRRKPMQVDTETTTEYHLLSDHHIQAASRIVVFPSTFSASQFRNPSFCPTSVTVLDYDVSMHRTVQPFQNLWTDAIEERPCVETPNGIVQCY